MPDPNNYTPLDEVNEWVPNIVALQDGWPPNGGAVDPANNSGLLNWPLLQLASRTLWLKEQADQLAADFANFDVSTQINAAIDALVNGAPAALDTLSELAAALQDNDDQVSALITQIAGKVPTSRVVTASGLATGGGDLSSNRMIDVPAASQAEAEAGINATKAMTPLTTKQAIEKLSPKTNKAWVNFNGSGTVDITAAMNVSSITDNGTGYYTMNFIEDMPHANYAVSATVSDGELRGHQISIISRSTTQLSFKTARDVSSNYITYDSNDISVVIFA
ncbi:MAG: hypothetical protein JXR35_04040 [Rhodobacteraceae bacterium]|nr:hypothetical protein [Paracoccaceae bacterium]